MSTFTSGMHAADVAQDFEAVAAGQSEIEQQQVRALVGELELVVEIGRGGEMVGADEVVFGADQAADLFGENLVVFENPDGGGGGSAIMIGRGGG